MAKQLCIGCMRVVPPGEHVCPVCGQRHGVDDGQVFTLRPGTVLNQIYLVGKTIGQGGFGITYVGFDMMLQRKVAIKEYFPVSTGMVTRDNRSTVIWSQKVDSKNDQQRGFDSFLKEARKMAKLEQIPGVVGVRGMFQQNGTAYIVMDFIEGETLKNKLAKTGPMPFDDCVKLLTPTIRALERIHRLGIIHRDLSPDNIMLDNEGGIHLLDLGAAKDLNIQHSDGTVSSQLVAKHGFSPPEQYVDGGSIGSWTDVYALCATIYYCVTGKLPPKSTDRTYRDTFAIRPPLTQEQFDVLSRGMAIYYQSRIQTMGGLLEALNAVCSDSEEERRRLEEEEHRRAEEAQRRKKVGICLGCMRKVTGPETVCPVCGYRHGTDDGFDSALKPGTVLKGKFLVGKVINQDGLSITYIGFDFVSEVKVKIKEYFPTASGMVTRENRASVVWSQQAVQKGDRHRGINDFLHEVELLSKLITHSSILKFAYVDVVQETFQENETAYIVMDFVEGETLRDRLKRTGPMQFYDCVKLLAPMLQELGQAHYNGIFHLDLSPDNIVLNSHGNIYLPDLCAPKCDLPDLDDDMPIIPRPFRALERYHENGKTGSWTDVYAICAIIYYCVTGKQPPIVTDRIFRDKLTLLPPLNQAQFDILRRGMEVKWENRTRYVWNLTGELAEEQRRQEEEERRKREEEERRRREEEERRRREEEERRKREEEERRRREEEEQRRREEEEQRKREEHQQRRWAEERRRQEAEDWRRQKTIKCVKIICAIFAALFLIALIHDYPLYAGTPAVNSSAQSTLSNVMLRPDFAKNADTFFWGQQRYKRSEVHHVVFLNTTSSAPRDAFDVSYAGNRSILAWMDSGTLYIGSGRIISLFRDASELFYHFEKLESIDFGDNVDTSKVTDMSWMFAGCKSLTSLDLSCFDTSMVTKMNGMFEFCHNLTSVNLSSFDTRNVRDMSKMFGSCDSLKTLDLSNFDTRNVTDMSWMFESCDSLKTLDLSNFDTSKVTNMFWMFYSCDKLKTLNLRGINAGNVTNMSSMFAYCSSLTTLDVRKVTINSKANTKNIFKGCNITDLRYDSSLIKQLYDAR